MNLFHISNDLRALYDELEENGGEITPELEENLSIKENDFLAKIDDYVSLIRMMEADVSLCNSEIKRITETKKAKEKSIERLKKIVSAAVLEFGDTTKTGTKCIEYGTYKISTRKTKICDVNEDELNAITNKTMYFIGGLLDNNLIGTGHDSTEEAIKFLNEESSIKYGREDLQNIKYNINFTGNIGDLLSSNDDDILKRLLNDADRGSIKFDVNKTECKKTMENGKVLAFANLEENNSIIIK